MYCSQSTEVKFVWLQQCDCVHTVATISNHTLHVEQSAGICLAPKRRVVLKPFWANKMPFRICSLTFHHPRQDRLMTLDNIALSCKLDTMPWALTPGTVPPGTHLKSDRTAALWFMMWQDDYYKTLDYWYTVMTMAFEQTKALNRAAFWNSQSNGKKTEESRQSEKKPLHLVHTV
jgi:hypothetical protein